MKNRLIIDNKEKTFSLLGYFYGRIDEDYLYISDQKGEEIIPLYRIFDHKLYDIDDAKNGIRIMPEHSHYPIGKKRWIAENCAPDIIFPSIYLVRKFKIFINNG